MLRYRIGGKSLEKQITDQFLEAVEDQLDYKKMYITLFRAVDRAIDDLIHAQLACEELYIAAGQRLDEVELTDDPVKKQLIQVLRSEEFWEACRERIEAADEPTGHTKYLTKK